MYAQEKSRHFSCIIDENESLLVCSSDKASELEETDTREYFTGAAGTSRGEKLGIGEEWNEVEEVRVVDDVQNSSEVYRRHS